MTASTEAATSGKTATGSGARLAVELQRLHELKRQVAAQEQRLTALRTSSNSSLSDSNGAVGK